MGIFQQFPYSNFHEMNLDQIIKIMREMQDEWETTKTEWASYKDFIDNYFNNLDVTEEVLSAMRVMAADGSLNAILDPVIASTTTQWLIDNITITQGETVIDASLSIAGAAADAKATGDKFINLENDLYYESSDALIWENGGIAGTTGIIVDSTYRIRTSFIPRSIKIITPEPNFKVAVFVYNSAGEYLGNYNGAGYQTSLNFVTAPMNISNIPETFSIRLVGSFVNDSAIDVSSANNFIFTYLTKAAAYIIDPDTYGSLNDSQKIERAINAAGYIQNSIILIRRKYNLSANVLLNHYFDADAKLIFLGVGKNSGFNMAQYGFKAPDNTRSYGMVSFVNIKFTATNIFFAADYLIRMTFENCSFEGGNHVVYNTHYMQTWYFHNCVFRRTSGYLIDSRATGAIVLDLQMVECLIERCNGFMYGYDIQGAYINNCCIEALSELTVKVGRSARNLVVTDNYFEQNNTGFYIPPSGTPGNGNGEMFDFTAMTSDYLNHVVIENNRFAQNPTNEIILLGSRLLGKGYIVIKNNVNVTAGTPTFIKTPNDATLIRTDVILEGNSNAGYSDPSLIIDRTTATIAVVTELTNENLNTLLDPGYYHAASNHSVVNAPTTGEFYLMHIRTDSGTAQIAITSTGTKSRMNNGVWN